MSARSVPGALVSTPDAADLARRAAAHMASVLRRAQGPRAVATLALSGGESPRAAYASLAREPGIDWGRVEVFWVDERAVPPGDDRSNFRWAKATLLDAAGVPPARVHRMIGEAADLGAAAAAYEQQVRARVAPDDAGLPAFDLMVLGVGEDGHTASLFPGEPTVDVSDRLVASVPAKAGREARLTLTPPVIERARDAVVITPGAAKRRALDRVWADRGDVHETPARVLRACAGALTWFVDPRALGEST